MIIQHRDDTVVLISQADHALLAGQIASLWGGGADRFGRWDDLVVAAKRHDDGWIDFDRSPDFSPSGTPYDFITTPLKKRIEIYRRGVETVLTESPWTILLVSMHLTGLFLGRYEPDSTKMIELLQGDEREIAQSFVDQETARQNRIAGEFGEDPMPHYRLMQVFDRLSLTLCLQPLESIGKNTIPFVPLVSQDESSTLTLWNQNGSIRINPYPLERDVELSLPITPVSKSALSSPDDYRASISAAGMEEMSIRFSSN